MKRRISGGFCGRLAKMEIYSNLGATTFKFPKVVLYALVALVVWRVAYCIYYGEAFAQNVLHNLRKIQADMFTRDELTLLLIGFAAIYYRL